jgi:cytochrome c
MTEITQFVATAFDLIDGDFVAVEPIVCAGPALAIQTALGQWKFLGHAGAVAFSRTSDFNKGKYQRGHVLRRFGQVPDEYLGEDDGAEFRIAAILFGLSASAALAQDVAAGATSFRKCSACHSIGVGAQNKIGPLLNGIDGRRCGSVGGYSYSEANRNCPFTWNEAVFLDYIKDPKLTIPGTKKLFAGIKDATEARNLWSYLRQFGNDGQAQ